MTRIVLKNSREGGSSLVQTGEVHEFVFEDIRQVEIVLHDAFRRRIPRAEFEVSWSGGHVRGSSDDCGNATFRLPADVKECSVRWRGQADLAGADWAFETSVAVTMSAIDTLPGQAQRLTNLGFSGEDDQTAWLRRFQGAWGLPTTGYADAITLERLEAAAHCERPEAAQETESEASDERRT